MWFGESWGAPVNEGPHAETPVGQMCAHCAEVVAEGESGVIVPAIKSLDQPPTFEPWHFECWMREAVGSVGHQMKRCHCFGGNEGDPAGMTLREAAAAAWGLFNKMHGQGEA